MHHNIAGPPEQVTGFPSHQSAFARLLLRQDALCAIVPFLVTGAPQF